MVAERNGTMVIIDHHSEYRDLKISRLKVIEPKLNPRYLSAEELADVVGVRAAAEKQRAMLGEVLDKNRAVRGAENFWEALKEELNKIANNGDAKAPDRYTATRLVEIIDSTLRLWGQIFDLRARNVLDVSEYIEAQAQILLSHLLKELLEDRKNVLRGIRMSGSGRRS